MGIGRKGKATGIFRRESKNPNSLFKPSIPRKIKELNSRLYASLKSLNSGWKKEDGYLTYENEGMHVTCRYAPQMISHKSKKLYHQSEKYFFVHAGGLPVKPKREEIRKYVGLEAEVICFGRAVVIKSKTTGTSEQGDIEGIVRPLLDYIVKQQ